VVSAASVHLVVYMFLPATKNVMHEALLLSTWLPDNDCHLLKQAPAAPLGVWHVPWPTHTAAAAALTAQTPIEANDLLHQLTLQVGVGSAAATTMQHDWGLPWLLRPLGPWVMHPCPAWPTHAQRCEQLPCMPL
jgi:hypothetical protein